MSAMSSFESLWPSYHSQKLLRKINENNDIVVFNIIRSGMFHSFSLRIINLVYEPDKELFSLIQIVDSLQLYPKEGGMFDPQNKLMGELYDFFVQPNRQPIADEQSNKEAIAKDKDRLDGLLTGISELVYSLKKEKKRFLSFRGDLLAHTGMDEVKKRILTIGDFDKKFRKTVTMEDFRNLLQKAINLLVELDRLAIFPFYNKAWYKSIRELAAKYWEIDITDLAPELSGIL
jgi:hypothetical protein